MNRTKLKNYAPQARRDFIQAMTDRAAFFGLTAKKTEPVVEKGDVAVIGGRSFPIAVAKKRKSLEDRIKRHGFEQTMEAMAYTWFNRLVAIRFMELHGYLDHGYRVLSHPEGKPTPEIRFIRGFGGIANRSITEVCPVLHPEGMSAISRGLSARDTPGSVRTK